MLTGTSKDSKIIAGLLEHQLQSTRNKIEETKNKAKIICEDNDEKFISLASSKIEKHTSTIKLNSLEFSRRNKGGNLLLFKMFYNKVIYNNI